MATQAYEIYMEFVLSLRKFERKHSNIYVKRPLDHYRLRYRIAPGAILIFHNSTTFVTLHFVIQTGLPTVRTILYSIVWLAFVSVWFGTIHAHLTRRAWVQCKTSGDDGRECDRAKCTGCGCQGASRSWPFFRGRQVTPGPVIKPVFTSFHLSSIAKSKYESRKV